MPLQDLLSRASSLLADQVAREPLSTAAPTKHAVPHTLSQRDPHEALSQAIALLQTVLTWAPNRDDAREESPTTQVPLIWCDTGVEAGSQANATIHVANDHTEPVEAALYFSNFIADTGHEIPSVAGHASPRLATIPPGGEATFEIKLTVPQQTPAGTYSGLVQVTNGKYVKAVLILEVS